MKSRRSSRLLRSMFLGLLVVGITGRDSNAGSFTGMYVFGDSLSDVGNVYTVTGHTYPPPPYDQGRFSNGPTWAEDLATGLGLSLSPSVTGGNGYAWGGAKTGAGLTTDGLPNIDTQIGLFQASGAQPLSTDLIALWAGADDILFRDQVSNYQTIDSVQNIGWEISALVALGARQFLIPNLPDLGDIPQPPVDTPAERTTLNELSRLFNSQLQVELQGLRQQFQALGVRIIELDVNALIRAAEADPAKFGFTNTTDAVLLDPNFNWLTDDPNTYLFWDGLHPTAGAHAYLASAALAAIPEPSSFALMVAAGVSLYAGNRQIRARRRMSI